MPSNDDFSEILNQAGRRAAERTGPAAPPLDSISAEVARKQRGRQTLAGVVAVLTLALVVPVAAFFFGRASNAPSVTTAAATSAAVAVDEVSSQAPVGADDAASNEFSAVAGNSGDLAAQDQDFEADLDENVNVQVQVGDREYSLEVIVDAQAPVRGAEAEAGAEDTRVINDTTIWLRDVDGQTEASALVDGDIFAAAVGPRDEVIDALDDLTEFAESAAPLLNGDFNIEGLLDGDADLEGLLGDDFDIEQFFGEDFDPQQFFGEDFDPQQFFDGGELPFDPGAFLGDDFDLEGLFGEDFDPESFLGEDFDPRQFFGEDFDLDDLFEDDEAVQS